MEPFFQELLLEGSAIYTLWGSKPITRCILYYYSEEELQYWYDHMTEEEKKTSFVRENPHFEENWEKWEKIQDQFPMTRYLLFKTDNPIESKTDPKTAMVYFVNILQTALTMLQHYELFKEAVGTEFNPFDMAYDFKNRDSPFWQLVSDNSALMGILFGYGRENSWMFHWKHFDHDEKKDHFAKIVTTYSSDYSRQGKNKLADFSLPAFMVINTKDKMIKKYRKEREEIKKIYKGQDFVELTLQKMTAP
jgi:hypothetical protein